jgi:hypothetical protein
VCAEEGALLFSSEAVLERTELQLERAEVVERATVWRYGGRFGLTGALRLSASWGLWAGADATLLTPDVAVRVDSTATDQESSIRWTAGAGVRFYAAPRPEVGP